MSYVQFAKPIKTDELQKDVAERLSGLRFNYEAWEKVSHALLRWDGKKITKRLADDIAKVTGYQVTLSNPCSDQLYLTIRGIRKECRIFLGYGSPFDHSKFMSDYSVSDQNCKPVADTLEKGLKSLPKLVDEYNNLLNLQQELVKEATKCGMEYDFDILAKDNR
jgi:hypothetical protein